MNLLENLKKEVLNNKKTMKKVNFEVLPPDIELPSAITNVYERDDENIVVEFTIVYNGNTQKKTRMFGGNYGKELLSNLLKCAGISDVNDIVGKYSYIKLINNGQYTNIEVVQFIDEDEFMEVIEGD